MWCSLQHINAMQMMFKEGIESNAGNVSKSKPIYRRLSNTFNYLGLRVTPLSHRSTAT